MAFSRVPLTPDINLVLGFRKIHRPGVPDRLPRPAMTQMLRSFAFVLFRRQDFHRAAGLFDCSDSGFRRAMNLDGHLRLDLAPAEQPHPALGAANGAGFHQRFGIDDVLGVERFGVNRRLNAVEIDLGKFDPEDVRKTALGQAPVQRHLAAFETFDAHAGARGLALAAAARRLALAGADATADPHALLARAGIVGDFAELHRSTLILFFVMPRLVPGIHVFLMPRRGWPGQGPAVTAKTLFLVDDADEVLNLCDHAANRRRILQLGDAANLVELEADQRGTLRVMAADRAAGLLDLDRLCGLGHRLNSKRPI